jgi:hypothetical protein
MVKTAREHVAAMSIEKDFLLACLIVVVGSYAMVGFIMVLLYREGRLPPWNQFRRLFWKNVVDTLRHPRRFFGLD